MGEMAEYWQDVKPILKEQNRKARERNYGSRIQTAIDLFEKNKFEYKICNLDNGHFNILKNKKVIASYWTWTGKLYIPRTGFSENIGIKNSIKKIIKEINNDI